MPGRGIAARPGPFHLPGRPPNWRFDRPFAQPEIPQTIPGLVLWRRPESLPTAAAVAAWHDHSGHGSHAAQPTGTEQPARVAADLDGYATVDFDGTDDILDQDAGDLLSRTNGAGSLLYLAVVKVDTVDATVRDVIAISGGAATNAVRFKCGQRAPAGTVWSLSARRDDAVAAQNLESATAVDTGWHLLTAQIDWVNSNAWLYLGGTEIASTTTFLTDGTVSATNALTAKTGGRQDGIGELWNGRIAEDLLYVTAAKVADADRQALWDYLLAKYPTIAPAGDATVTPATIATTVALPAAAVSVEAAPAAAAAAVAVPQAAVGVGAAPAVLGAAVALPQPAVGVGAAPATLGATVAVLLPAAVGQVGDANVGPATIAALAALPQPGVGVGAAPAVLGAAAALPQPGVGVGAAPASFAGLAALAKANIGVGAAPATIAGLAALAKANVGVGAAPAAIVAAATLPLPTQVGQGGAGATATPAAIAVLSSLPQPGVGVGAAPTTIALSVNVTLASGIDAGPAPLSFATPVTLPQPGVGVGAAPASFAVLAALAKANVGVGVTPATIVAVVAVLLPERVGPPAGINVNPEGPVMVGAVVLVTDAVGGATTGPLLVGGVVLVTDAVGGATARPGVMVGGIS